MIKFYGLLDFFPNRKQIKEEFDKLTLDERIKYKKEVYSICFEREYAKDLIWEYLNDWEYSQFDLAKEYRIRKTKLDKRIKQEEERKKYYQENEIYQLKLEDKELKWVRIDESNNTIKTSKLE